MEGNNPDLQRPKTAEPGEAETDDAETPDKKPQKVEEGPFKLPPIDQNSSKLIAEAAAAS